MLPGIFFVAAGVCAHRGISAVRRVIRNKRIGLRVSGRRPLVWLILAGGCIGIGFTLMWG